MCSLTRSVVRTFVHSFAKCKYAMLKFNLKVEGQLMFYVIQLAILLLLLWLLLLFSFYCIFMQLSSSNGSQPQPSKNANKTTTTAIHNLVLHSFYFMNVVDVVVGWLGLCLQNRIHFSFSFFSALCSLSLVITTPNSVRDFPQPKTNMRASQLSFTSNTVVSMRDNYSCFSHTTLSTGNRYFRRK